MPDAHPVTESELVISWESEEDTDDTEGFDLRELRVDVPLGAFVQVLFDDDRSANVFRTRTGYNAHFIGEGYASSLTMARIPPHPPREPSFSDFFSSADDPEPPEHHSASMILIQMFNGEVADVALGLIEVAERVSGQQRIVDYPLRDEP